MYNIRIARKVYLNANKQKTLIRLNDDPIDVIVIDAEVKTINFGTNSMRIVYIDPTTNQKITEDINSSKFFEKYNIIEK